MYDPIPSPILCGSETVISMNWSLLSSVATSSIVVDFESGWNSIYLDLVNWKIKNENFYHKNCLSKKKSIAHTIIIMTNAIQQKR